MTRSFEPVKYRCTACGRNAETSFRGECFMCYMYGPQKPPVDVEALQRRRDELMVTIADLNRQLSEVIGQLESATNQVFEKFEYVQNMHGVNNADVLHEAQQFENIEEFEPTRNTGEFGHCGGADEMMVTHGNV